ncbi:Early meiotic induction protein 1 [Pseudozyma hubeiensis]|nr:Early meiotic induction protein 1 [Pseudozyma hubeiensis]
MSSSSSSTTTTSQYERFLAEDVLYHKASTPISEMPSCTDMFDRWASCFALGPQLKAVYRYGGVQDCKEKMDDFKHCLTMKGMTQEEKYEEWITRKAERTAERRLGKGSAENVWVLRRDPNEEVRSKGEVSGTIV